MAGTKRMSDKLQNKKKVLQKTLKKLKKGRKFDTKGTASLKEAMRAHLGSKKDIAKRMMNSKDRKYDEKSKEYSRRRRAEPSTGKGVGY